MTCVRLNVILVIRSKKHSALEERLQVQVSSHFTWPAWNLGVWPSSDLNLQGKEILINPPAYRLPARICPTHKPAKTSQTHRFAPDVLIVSLCTAIAVYCWIEHFQSLSWLPWYWQMRGEGAPTITYIAVAQLCKCFTHVSQTCNSWVEVGLTFMWRPNHTLWNSSQGTRM